MNEFIDRVIARLRKGWCKGHYAVNDKGYTVHANSATACRWCLVGAIDAEYSQSIWLSIIVPLKERLYKLTGYSSLVTYNDYRSKDVDEVIDNLERAKDAPSGEIVGQAT